VELYNHVAGTHKETKQFFTLYNTLDDTKLYLGKEVSSTNLLVDVVLIVFYIIITCFLKCFCTG